MLNDLTYHNEHPNDATQSELIVSDLAGETQQQQTSLAQLQQKQAYEKRLLNLFIHAVQETGECSYPDLVTLADNVYEVEQAQAGELLTNRQLDLLNQRLEQDVTDIETAVESLQQNLAELTSCLQNAEDISSREQGIDQQIQQAVCSIHRGISDLIRQAHTYLPLQEKVKKKNSEKAQQQQDWKKQLHDLRYFCDYLDQHLQVSVIKEDFIASQYREHYFRRVEDYQQLLVRNASRLKDDIKLALEDKRPGGKFASTERC